LVSASSSGGSTTILIRAPRRDRTAQRAAPSVDSRYPRAASPASLVATLSLLTGANGRWPAAGCVWDGCV
jgi:hypothetical protein